MIVPWSGCWAQMEGEWGGTLKKLYDFPSQKYWAQKTLEVKYSTPGGETLDPHIQKLVEVCSPFRSMSKDTSVISCKSLTKYRLQDPFYCYLSAALAIWKAARQQDSYTLPKL